MLMIMAQSGLHQGFPGLASQHVSLMENPILDAVVQLWEK